jgi:uncharacterized OB-fold protein
VSYLKPLPEADEDSAPFWQGCREHELRLQYCPDCDRHQFPPGPNCQTCRSKDMEWVSASGKGKVYSWIVVTHPVPREVYGDDVPYIVALIDLAEGARMASNLLACAPQDVVADMAVEVVFDDVTEDVTLAKFKPV